MYHAIEVDQVAIDIVDYLDGGRRTQEIQRGAAGEHFDVTLVLRKARYQMIRETALAADPGNDRVCHVWIAFSRSTIEFGPPTGRWQGLG